MSKNSSSAEPLAQGSADESALILRKAQPKDLGNLMQVLASGGELTKQQQTILEGVVNAAAEREPSLVAQIAFRQEMYSGPLPHYEQLNGYDPETRKQIVDMAVREQLHTHEMQRNGLFGAIWKDRLGQLLGFGIAIAGLAAAAWISQYSAVAAAIIGGLDLLGMVSVFVAPRAFEKLVESRSKNPAKPPGPKPGKRK